MVPNSCHLRGLSTPTASPILVKDNVSYYYSRKKGRETNKDPMEAINTQPPPTIDTPDISVGSLLIQQPLSRDKHMMDRAPELQIFPLPLP